MFYDEESGCQQNDESNDTIDGWWLIISMIMSLGESKKVTFQFTLKSNHEKLIILIIMRGE